MDAAQALADLTELSAQIERAAVVDGDGDVLASTTSAPPSRPIATTTSRLGSADSRSCSTARTSRGLSGVAQLEAATLGGSVFVVQDGRRLIAATTRPEPTVGLVFYDLKHCLRAIDDGDAAA